MIICAGNLFSKKSVKIQNSRFKKIKKFKLRLSVSSVQLLFNLWQYIYLFVFINPYVPYENQRSKKKNCFANRGNPSTKQICTQSFWYLIYFMSLIP